MLKRKNIKIELMKERAKLLEEERISYATPRFYNKFPLKENNVGEIEVHEDLEEVELDDIDREYLTEKFMEYKLLVENIINNHEDFINDKGLEEEILNVIGDTNIISEVTFKTIRIPIPSVKLAKWKKWGAGTPQGITRTMLPKLLRDGGTIADGGKYIDTLLEAMNTKFKHPRTKEGTGRSQLGEMLYQSSWEHGPWKTDYANIHAKLKKLLTTLQETKSNMWSERLDGGRGGFTAAGKKVLKKAGFPIGKNGEPAISHKLLMEMFQIDQKTARNIQESVLSHAISKMNSWKAANKIKAKLRDQFYVTRAEFRQFAGKGWTVIASAYNRVKNSFKKATPIAQTGKIPLNDRKLIEKSMKKMWVNIRAALNGDKVGTLETLNTHGYINFFDPKVLNEVIRIAQKYGAEAYTYIKIEGKLIPLYGGNGRNINTSHTRGYDLRGPGWEQNSSGLWVQKKHIKQDTKPDTGPTIKPDNVKKDWGGFEKSKKDLEKRGFEEGDPPDDVDAIFEVLVDPDQKIHRFWKKKKIKGDTKSGGVSIMDGLRNIWKGVIWANPLVKLGHNILFKGLEMVGVGKLLQRLPLVGKAFKAGPFLEGNYVSRMIYDVIKKRWEPVSAASIAIPITGIEVYVRLTTQAFIVVYIQQIFTESEEYVRKTRENDMGGTEEFFLLIDRDASEEDIKNGENYIKDFTDPRYHNPVYYDKKIGDDYVNRFTNPRLGNKIWPLSDEEIEKRDWNPLKAGTYVGGKAIQYIVEWRKTWERIKWIGEYIGLEDAAIDGACKAFEYPKGHERAGEELTGSEYKDCQRKIKSMGTKMDQLYQQYKSFIEDGVEKMSECINTFEAKSIANRKLAGLTDKHVGKKMAYDEFKELELENCEKMSSCQSQHCAKMKTQIKKLAVTENWFRDHLKDKNTKLYWNFWLNLQESLNLAAKWKQLKFALPKIVDLFWDKKTGKVSVNEKKEEELIVPIPWDEVLMSTGKESVIGAHLKETYLCDGCSYCFVDCTNLLPAPDQYNQWSTDEKQEKTDQQKREEQLQNYLNQNNALKDTLEESRIISEQRNKVESKYEIEFVARALTIAADPSNLETKIELIIEQAIVAAMTEGITWEEFVIMNNLKWLEEIPLADIRIGPLPELKYTEKEPEDTESGETEPEVDEE